MSCVFFLLLVAETSNFVCVRTRVHHKAPSYSNGNTALAKASVRSRSTTFSSRVNGLADSALSKLSGLRVLSRFVLVVFHHLWDL